MTSEDLFGRVPFLHTRRCCRVLHDQAKLPGISGNNRCNYFVA